MKVAVVTPYFKESDAVLLRCINSVLMQSHENINHYLISDGFPKPHITSGIRNLISINLPVNHNDYGCTPRSVGAVCALNEGADIICFLDADNLFESNHVSSLVSCYQQSYAQGQTLDAVFADRKIFFPGHEHLRIDDPEDARRNHVDTSCLSFGRSAAFIWSNWGLIPKAWTPICDRVMFKLAKVHGLKMAWTGLHTVLYESNWRSHYKKAGLPVPAHGLHDGTIRNIVKPSDHEIFSRLRILSTSKFIA